MAWLSRPIPMYSGAFWMPRGIFDLLAAWVKKLTNSLAVASRTGGGCITPHAAPDS